MMSQFEAAAPGLVFEIQYLTKLSRFKHDHVYLAAERGRSCYCLLPRVLLPSKQAIWR